ncbi:PAS domain S-box protein [Halobacteria archaeon AArc-m2/3/4]|uniref:histidine kinase n=1 Tax=Natronoglomus mannanivorans TaxID=2979990 RepID=A0AAP3E1K5_9EURY|nr:PAS domain S-box protein [Halobacteria archaeon AArc-xg1-1]MCU4973640.1 PAS domain S-box protein [Halobacteria archaeon AArc-m2/3/4]
MDSGPSDSSPPRAGQPSSARSVHADPLLAQAGIGSFRATSSGELLAVNDAFTSLTGHAQSALLGRQFSALLADGAASPLESFGDDTDGFEPVTTQCELRTATDRLVSCTLHLRRAAAADRDDSAVDLVGLVQRSPLAESPTADTSLTYGKTFAALAEALPDGIIVLDTDSDIQYANPAVERILGFESEELVGDSKVKIIPERLRETHLTALQRYLETGERHINWTYVELPGQHKEGHEVPLGVSLNDFTYDGEHYFVGLFRDISLRKQTERDLSAKVAQLETVAYLGRHALESADVDDLLTKATELVAAALDAEYCKVLELDSDHEALLVREGYGWTDGIVGEATVSATAADSQAGYTLSTDQPVVVEDLETDSRFGGPALLTDHDVRSGISVTIGPPDDPWGILGVHSTDTREFADHDVDFVQSIATVLATAIERTEYEDRLNATVDELEESNERLEQFAYAASHDLQEPLRMISSYLGLLERRYAEDLDEDATDFIEFAVDGADRMRAMIDGLLTYSRVDTQGEPLEPTAVGSVVENALANLQVQLEEADAEVDVAVGDLPTVLADDNQLEQVFQNLVSNAIKYCEGNPKIEIDAEAHGDEWVFHVADDGPGIDPEDQDRIFEVFQRLGDRGSGVSGTGIGLALCKKIVERHGGRIWVDSDPGEGATFSFTIPDRC